MVVEAIEHPWFGLLRRYGENQLIGSIGIDPAVRPARLNGQTDAEVLITVGSLRDGPELDVLLTSAAQRIQAALTGIERIVAFAVARAPSDWRPVYEGVEEVPLKDRLFLEGFEVISPTEMEISFDVGDLDMLVVRVDAAGHGRDAYYVA